VKQWVTGVVQLLQHCLIIIRSAYYIQGPKLTNLTRCYKTVDFFTFGNQPIAMLCCLCTVGQVVHTLPEGESVHGVTTVGDEVFVLRCKSRDHIEVYDVIAYRLRRHITVPSIRGFANMTSCEHHRCVYISDHVVECIHRVDVRGGATRWAVNDEPSAISVNVARNVLVACDVVHKIKEFSSHGDLLRAVTLPDDVLKPWHAVQLTSGQLVVCHGGGDNTLHRVCMLTPDGSQTVHSHGGARGSNTGQYDVPKRLAVDDNGFVFVVDLLNRRVTLLSPTLSYVRQVVSSDKLTGQPDAPHLDVQRRRLYVADKELKNGKYTAGRVMVFSV